MIRLFKKDSGRPAASSPQSDVKTAPLSYIPQIELPDTLEVSMASVIGTRLDQQDTMRLQLIDAGVAAVICDGMGGLSNGQLASRTAADTFLDAVAHVPASELPDSLAQILESSSDAVCRTARGGGSTLVGAVVCGRSLFFCSVGDSKLFIFRAGQMVCATREHTVRLLLNERLQRGQISHAQYQRELSHAEALISYLGAPSLCYTDISCAPFELQPGDTILLCSDGLYRSIPEDRLQQIVCGYAGSFCTLADYLVSTAARLCAQRDNTSVILLRMRAPEPEKMQFDTIV